jgi:hypothetical protein
MKARFKNIVTGAEFAEPYSNWTSFGLLYPNTTESFELFVSHVYGSLQLSVPRGKYFVGVQYIWRVWDGQRWFWSPSYTRWGPPSLGWYQYWASGAYLDTTYCDTRIPQIAIPDSSVCGYLCSGADSAAAAEAAPAVQFALRLRHLRRSTPSGAAAQVGYTCGDDPATIVGTPRSDEIRGTPEADVIVALQGDDIVLGRDGSDIVCAGPGNDHVAGDAGDDVLLGDNGHDFLTGNDGNDTISAQRGDDIVHAGAGIDIVEGGVGRDQMFGGGQELDIVAYLFSKVGVDVDFGSGVGPQGDSFTGFNAVVGSPHDDTLLGTDGEQWIVPLEGADVVDGGAGYDVVAYLLASQAVEVDLSAGIGSGEGRDILESLENVVGSSHDDVIMGSPTYNLLLGREGNDALDGVGGDDILLGEAGDSDRCINGDFFIECENQAEDVVTPQVGDAPPQDNPPPPPE